MNKLFVVFLVTFLLVSCNSSPQSSTTETVKKSAETTTKADNETVVPTTEPKSETTATSTEPSVPASLELTLEALKEFNGKDGKPAYIAIEGIIYDVTNAPYWKEGAHNGFEAGQDLTEAMRDISPHGFSKLKLVVAVGSLADN